FVGPNNSGKSKLLTEIHEYCSNGDKNHNSKLIDTLSFLILDERQREEEIEKFTIKPKPDQVVTQGQILFGSGERVFQVDGDFPNRFLSSPNSEVYSFCQHYLSLKTLKLDALNRIWLANQQELGNLQQPPTNNLAILFKNDDKRVEVRRIIYDAFKLYFVLDPTNVGQVRIRFSKTSPQSHLQERGLHQEAIEFHRNALDVSLASDGMKAFTGIITSIVAGEPKVTLLDEPEAFLHPSLSFKLGKEIATSSKDKLNRLFVSTHSSNFLMGCIQSGAPINIVRLTYSNEIGTARLLNNNKIVSLMKDPLLRSTGVLSALFYNFVVVTEGDSDRAFYQEINERLIQFSPERAIQDCLFINAVGKDSIWKIVQPLREMGIPTVGVYDIDILKNEGNNWTNALKASHIPEISHQSLGQIRSRLKNKFDEIGKNMKKDGGISALPSSEKEAADNLFNQLEVYGIFAVRNGEVEHWLSDLEVEANKSNWLAKIFERMGANPDDQDYVKPTKGDVWDFLGRISTWMKNENRKGIPR
ncbi:MAG: AAA family ATPase, partial [Bacteroidota bacterium]